MRPLWLLFSADFPSLWTCGHISSWEIYRLERWVTAKSPYVSCARLSVYIQTAWHMKVCVVLQLVSSYWETERNLALVHVQPQKYWHMSSSKWNSYSKRDIILAKYRAAQIWRDTELKLRHCAIYCSRTSTLSFAMCCVCCVACRPRHLFLLAVGGHLSPCRHANNHTRCQGTRDDHKCVVLQCLFHRWYEKISMRLVRSFMYYAEVFWVPVYAVFYAPTQLWRVCVEGEGLPEIYKHCIRFHFVVLRFDVHFY